MKMMEDQLDIIREARMSIFRLFQYCLAKTPPPSPAPARRERHNPHRYNQHQR